jgi:predicted phosphodiesterase
LKIAVMSDLHLEFESRSICDVDWNDLVERRRATAGHPKIGPWLGEIVGVDLVVLAGDIWTGSKGMAYAYDVARFTDAPVVYVMGNHEGYSGDNIDFLIEEMRGIASATKGRVYFLENGLAWFGGVAVLGATLWTDFEANVAETGEYDRDAVTWAIQDATNGLNDFRRCRLRGSRLTASATRGLHQVSRKWLDMTITGIRVADPEAQIVVVTHHAPILEANPPEYRGGTLAPAFASDMRAEIEKWQPDLWVWGHTHHSMDVRIGETRLVSSQRGYVGVEPGATAFRPAVVEIDTPKLTEESDAKFR